MKTQSGKWSPETGFSGLQTPLSPDGNYLVLFFGDRNVFETSSAFEDMQKQFPNADLVGCYSGGEILHNDVLEGSLVYLCIQFEASDYKVYAQTLESPQKSIAVGQDLGKSLHRSDLKAVLILADPSTIQATNLIKGIKKQISDTVKVVGGFATDHAEFKKTCVGFNAPPEEKQIAAIGFYGGSLIAKTSSADGWSAFGPTRRITKTKGSQLFELDGKPALDLYKNYLGEEAKNLPSSALYFPCAIWSPEEPMEHYLVRTVLNVNEDSKSLIFNGDLPPNYNFRLLWGKFDNLIEAAGLSALNAMPFSNPHSRSLSLIISCLGRKKLMGQRIVGEIQEAIKHLGSETTNIGFYSFGEITNHCISHKTVFTNQTLSVLTLSEVA